MKFSFLLRLSGSLLMLLLGIVVGLLALAGDDIPFANQIGVLPAAHSIRWLLLLLSGVSIIVFKLGCICLAERCFNKAGKIMDAPSVPV